MKRKRFVWGSNSKSFISFRCSSWLAYTESTYSRCCLLPAQPSLSYDMMVDNGGNLLMMIVIHRKTIRSHTGKIWKVTGEETDSLFHWYEYSPHNKSVSHEILNQHSCYPLISYTHRRFHSLSLSEKKKPFLSLCSSVECWQDRESQSGNDDDTKVNNEESCVEFSEK